MTPEAVLVVCLGNPLRGDDGLGPAVGRRLLARGVSENAVRIVGGLVPELAADVAAAGEVVFVDAAGDGSPGAVRVEPVTPAHGAGRWTHHLDPPSLLALAAAVYGRVPPATLVTVAGHRWSLGQGLSAWVEGRIGEVTDLVAGRWTAGALPCGKSGSGR